MNIAILDGDISLTKLISEFLVHKGYETFVAHNSVELFKILNTNECDLILLDISLQGESGIDVCQKIRKQFRIPIIMLTASDDVVDLHISMQVGADYFMTKPFDSTVLLSHIKSAIRRSSEYSGTVSEKPCCYEYNDWHFNPMIGSLYFKEIEVVLTHKEYKLLQLFITNPNRILSRDYITNDLANTEHSSFDRSIDVLISRIRKKLSAHDPNTKYIRTVRNGGYLFSKNFIKKIL